ncbi:ortholog of human splicing factor SC35 [Prunus dulcis]|uniref:Ortholog of human splicing factor SC35 n=1 Tax=Prunus dulcis TaxID=3755 RepID=A0A5H2XVZ2_PRUDU|nr:ortholog of human splicing factor SC35 [Prunus dulcis]
MHSGNRNHSSGRARTMSHFGRSGPPDIADTYSLLVLNITFRTSADDLFPLFDKYGKVVDIFIPRDRRTGESRGFAFVRYKYADEAQKAVERLDGKVVDGREITVQFAKYGPNAERIKEGLLKLYQNQGTGQEVAVLGEGTGMTTETVTTGGEVAVGVGIGLTVTDTMVGTENIVDEAGACSASPDYYRSRRRVRYDDERRSRSRSRSPIRSRSIDSVSPARCSPSPHKSPSPLIRSRSATPARRSHDGHSPTSRSVSPRHRLADSRTPSPRNSDADARQFSVFWVLRKYEKRKKK